jgi:hypothetical protein
MRFEPLHLDTHLLEQSGQLFSGASFLKSQFWVGVEIAPHGYQPVVEGLILFIDHAAAPLPGII